MSSARSPMMARPRNESMKYLFQPMEHCNVFRCRTCGDRLGERGGLSRYSCDALEATIGPAYRDEPVGQAFWRGQRVGMAHLREGEGAK